MTATNNIAYFAGLDLGQSQDFTALAILERTRHTDPVDPETNVKHYAVRHLQRWAPGTGYHEIITDVANLLQPLIPVSPLAVDATGVGKPVVDLLQAYRMPCPIHSITITSGHHLSGSSEGGLHVPKKDLVSTLQVLLQSRLLKIASTLSDAATLTAELMTFQAKVTLDAGDSCLWRERPHDDLVLAVAIAAWLGENQTDPYTGPLVYWPPVADECTAGGLHGLFDDLGIDPEGDW